MTTIVIPAEGVTSVRVRRDLPDSRTESGRNSCQSYRNPRRFDSALRIEIIVEHAAGATVFDAIAGFLSDAEMWIEAPKPTLSA